MGSHIPGFGPVSFLQGDAIPLTTAIVPAAYVPVAVGGFNVDTIRAHLAGIDAALGGGAGPWTEAVSASSVGDTILHPDTIVTDKVAIGAVDVSAAVEMLFITDAVAATSGQPTTTLGLGVTGPTTAAPHIRMVDLGSAETATIFRSATELNIDAGLRRARLEVGTSMIAFDDSAITLAAAADTNAADLFTKLEDGGVQAGGGGGGGLTGANWIIEGGVGSAAFAASGAPGGAGGGMTLNLGAGGAGDGAGAAGADGLFTVNDGGGGPVMVVGGAVETVIITGNVRIDFAAAGAALDINDSAVAYTTEVGIIDLVRSGNLTGVDTETIVDLNIVPTYTLTEPGAGSVNYFGANIDLSNLAVTAGAGSSVTAALNLVMSGDPDVGTEFGLRVEASTDATAQIGIVATNGEVATIQKRENGLLFFNPDSISFLPNNLTVMAISIAAPWVTVLPKGTGVALRIDADTELTAGSGVQVHYNAVTTTTGTLTGFEFLVETNPLTQGAGDDLIGASINFNDNVVLSLATAADVIGYHFESAGGTFTHGAGTTNIRGFDYSVADPITLTALGDLAWAGGRIVMPATIDSGTGGTLTVFGLEILGNALAGGTYQGLRVIMDAVEDAAITANGVISTIGGGAGNAVLAAMGGANLIDLTMIGYPGGILFQAGYSIGDTITSDLGGVDINFNASVTLSDGVDVRGYRIALPAHTQDSAVTSLIRGFTIETAGAITTATAGAGNDIEWDGVLIQMPAVTTNFAASNINAFGVRVLMDTVTEIAGTMDVSGILVDASGSVLDSATTSLLALQQGANDGPILRLKSTDIAHGLTTNFLQTDDFFAISKTNATTGGATLFFNAEDAAVQDPLRFTVFGGTADTTKSTAGIGLANIQVFEHNGAGTLANITADGNVFSVRARVGGATVTRLLLDEDGDLMIAGSLVVGAVQAHHTNMTSGITIDQNTADDLILALKSEDVATVLSTVTSHDVETDDYFTIGKASPTLGGTRFQALGEDAALTRTFILEAYGGTADTTKSTSGVGLVDIFVTEHNGANALANITADGNIFSVRARVGGANITALILDEDGDLWLNGGIAVGAGAVVQSNGAVEIGISVNNSALVVGSAGSMVIPYLDQAGAFFTDAIGGDVDGCIGINDDSTGAPVYTLEVRADGAWRSVAVAGYVIQRDLPYRASENYWAHQNQISEDGSSIDESKCVVCGDQMGVGQAISLYGNYDRETDLHCIFGHLHPERDPYIKNLVSQIAELKQQLDAVVSN